MYRLHFFVMMKVNEACSKCKWSIWFMPYINLSVAQSHHMTSGDLKYSAQVIWTVILWFLWCFGLFVVFFFFFFFLFIFFFWVNEFLNVLVNCSFKKKAGCTEQCFTPIQEDLGMLFYSIRVTLTLASDLNSRKCCLRLDLRLNI